MVSQLSARLLADYSDGSGSASGSGSDGERSSSGGYSADRESRTGSTSPPGQISMHIKHKRLSDNKERNKRRKFNEEFYAASVAKEDMKNAGLRIRPIETERSRITLGKVDMSNVQLVNSKEVGTSPFLVPDASKHSAHINYDFASESVYKTLLDSCRRAYELLDAVDTDSTDSTSSFSDTESDFDQGWKKEQELVIKPRVEDALPPPPPPPPVAPDPSLMSPVIVAQQVSPPPAVSMTMDEALTVCNFSRLMTLATAPYTVVHSNAACEQLTGLSSAKILGKPLFNGGKDDPSLASCAESSAAGRDVEFTMLGNDKKPIGCHMKVTPIVSSVKNAPTVTHYAVDLTAIGQSQSSLEAVALQARASNNQSLATTVVG